MTKQHPLTPPADLLVQWRNKAPLDHGEYGQRAVRERWLINKAAEWAADQELAACCDFLDDHEQCDRNFYKLLRNHRRPQSLKEQALAALETLNQAWTMPKEMDAVITIRRFFESLPE